MLTTNFIHYTQRFPFSSRRPISAYPGNSSAAAIPVVKLGEEISIALSGGDFFTNAWSSKRDEVRQTLEEYGCFIVENEELPADFGTKMAGVVEEFFSLPTETKMKNNNDSKLPAGYVDQLQLQLLPLYETMRIPKGTTLEGMKHVTNLLWPDQGNFKLCQTAHSLSKTFEGICQLGTRMIFESYGLSKYYDACLEDMDHDIRMTKYRAPEANENDTGLPPHVDTTFVTILYQNQVNGLEIETKSGVWLSVDLSPSSFLFLAGEGLTAWSNGRINAARHKVNMASKAKTRYSLGTFTNIRYIETPQELVDEEHPLQFHPYKHEDYNRAFYANMKPDGSLYSLRTFCGVKMN